jgi:hypothetical protein
MPVSWSAGAHDHHDSHCLVVAGWRRYVPGWRSGDELVGLMLVERGRGRGCQWFSGLRYGRNVPGFHPAATIRYLQHRLAKDEYKCGER